MKPASASAWLTNCAKNSTSDIKLLEKYEAKNWLSTNIRTLVVR